MAQPIPPNTITNDKEEGNCQIGGRNFINNAQQTKINGGGTGMWRLFDVMGIPYSGQKKGLGKPSLKKTINYLTALE